MNKQRKIKQLKTLKKQLFKKTSLRNLKIFEETCYYILPYFTSFAIVAGASKINNNGFPFVKEELETKKMYTLDYKSNVSKTIDENYSNDSLSNHLIIYSPWEYNDGKYIRYKREYLLKKELLKDIYDAVVNEDYNYILENVPLKYETKEITNEVREEDWLGIYWDADISYQDQEDFIMIEESTKHFFLKNLITILITFISGRGYNSIRPYTYRETCQQINDEYYKTIAPIEKKILLKSKKEDDCND